MGVRETLARISKNSTSEVRKVLPTTLANKILVAHDCDRSTDGKCLKRHPQQLTKVEVANMRRLVTSKKYSHFPISSLCLYAKRKDLVHCSRDTWYRYLNKFGWERPIKPKHSLKNQFLYHTKLRSKAEIVDKVGFYFGQHNEVVPQTKLRGLTPAEAFAGRDPKTFEDELKAKSAEERQVRRDTNRKYICRRCA